MITVRTSARVDDGGGLPGSGHDHGAADPPGEAGRRRPGLPPGTGGDRAAAGPSPATHAILRLLKTGETADLLC